MVSTARKRSFDLSSSNRSAENITVEPTFNEIQQALSASVQRALPSAAFSLGILYALLTIAHFFMLAPEHKPFLVPVAALSAVIFFGFYFYTRSTENLAIPSQTIAGLFGLIGLVNSLLHVAITNDPLQSSNIMIVIVAIGAFYLSVVWFWFTVATAFFGFVFVAFANNFEGVWVHFAIGILMSILVAVIINRVRVRAYTNLFRLRLVDERQRAMLEDSAEALELRVIERTREIEAVNADLTDEVGRRRKIESALKKSESELKKERSNLQNVVAKQTKELKEANVALKETADLRSRFMSELSYEIRPMIFNIINRLRSFEIRLQDRRGSIPRESVSETIKISNELLEKITNLNTVSRLNAEEIKVIMSSISVGDLSAELLNAAETKARPAMVKLSYNHDRRVQSIKADPKRLRYVLSTLMNLAIQNTPAGKEAGLAIRGNQANRTMQFVVWDTGKGYSEAEQKAFFAADVLGTLSSATGDLNLGLLNKLVQSHDGEIKVKSLQGSGTIFVVSLPWQEDLSVMTRQGQAPTNLALAKVEEKSTLPPIVNRLMQLAHI